MLAARFALVLLPVCLAMLGCRGCDDRDAAQAPPRQSESVASRVRARMAARDIDASKVYPKRPDGAVDCGSDVDCFVLQADRCAPALLEHSARMIGIGVMQRVSSRVRIAGAEDAGCRVLRTVLDISVEMAPAMRAELIKRGSTEREVDANLDELQAQLRKSYPPRQECVLSPHRALELALDLAEDSYLPSRYARECQTVGPDMPWVDDAPVAEAKPVSAGQPPTVPTDEAP